jgi:serine-type D-Ala-D-Ala carboxypeptidase/endopeptidase (penicillin-binding protein 4)
MARLFVRGAACVLVGVLCGSAGAKTSPKARHAKALGPQIAALLADPAVAQAHWGIAVTAMDGTPIYSMNEAQLFQPASNTKLFTTATALALLGGGKTFETRVVARGSFPSTNVLDGELLLVGAGDANLSGRTLPYVAPRLRVNPAAPPVDPLRYLEQMADDVVKSGIKVVNGDVVGDDTLFPYDPYAAEWSIEDAVDGDGVPVSALSINDNVIRLKVTPASVVGMNASVLPEPAIPYYTFETNVTTGAAKSDTFLRVDRSMGSKAVHIYGRIAVDAQPDVSELSIEDPAEYAAHALKQMLEERGVVVTGVARAAHLSLPETKGFLQTVHEPLPADAAEAQKANTNVGGSCADCVKHPANVERVVASHVSVPLLEDLTLTLKVSQNLHAELMLHQLGLTNGLDGSTAQGERVVRQFLLNAGIDKDDFVFFDGSGLSGHDLVAPRATARLLQYASTQPWFADWKKSLPVGGEDGSLAERFAKAPLAGHVFAKTGTLGEARALSGYLDCASGKTVIFSIMVGNHLPQTHVDRDVMDEIVAAIAAAN